MVPVGLSMEVVGSPERFTAPKYASALELIPL